MSDEEVKAASDRRMNVELQEMPPGSVNNEEDQKVKTRPKSPASNKRRRTRSRSFERRRSRSYSPDFRRGARRRFFRRSRSQDRFRGRYNRERSRDRDRFYGRRSRSRSRGRRFDRRNRRSNSRKSLSPPPPPAPQYQQQAPPPPMYSDPTYAAYPGYLPQNSFPYDYPGAYPPPAPAFIPQAPTAPNMILPGPPGDDFMGQSWAPMVNAPPPAIPENTIQESEEEKSKREEAVKKEMKTQREALRKQRDEYLNRSQNLKRELKILKQKRSDLMGSQNSNPPSPRTNSFIKENDKLQSQITNKLNTIMNVIDMLNGLIGKESDREDEMEEKTRKSPKPKSPPSNDTSPERLKSEVLESMNKNKEKKIKNEIDDKKKFNYIFYDPELHWCKNCDVFPKTAKDYLNHLQSKEHTEKQGEPETPWRENMPEPPQNNPDAVTKRTPIRGLQFFVPSAAWYCKLCSFWMGDLSSASAHLKSDLHSDKYNHYISQNPSFEVDWMSQRQHAYDFYRENESKKPKEPVEAKQPRDKQTVPSKLDQIPLNITGNNNQPAITIKAPLELPKKDDKKRKKKKKDERSKKKKKRGKKRKNRDSSSSSSSDSDSNSSSSESDKDKSKDSNAASIRVAMRKFLSQTKEEMKPEAVGKWTMVPPEAKIVPPPPPAISETQIKEKKRDELMISQWVSPEPIISQAEKKLLEQLKGRLKSQGKEASKNDQKEQEKNRERERVEKEKIEREKVEKERERVERDRERDRSRERVDRGGDRRIYRRRNSRESPSRSRSRDRLRRSRSRSYERRRYERRRYSRSRTRSRSRSRSRRIEKAIVPNFPSEPRLPPLREREEVKKQRVIKDKTKSSSSSNNKKLPFIGRMPVFKKQQNEKKLEVEEAEKVVDEPVKEAKKEQQEPTDMEVCYEDDMGLMPDPLAYSALMGAPPPPPVQPEQKIEEILPPGIDEEERHLIPKPISDAPIPRKGPLPIEFQETLNILFDGDKPKPMPDVKPPEMPAPLPIEPPDVDTDTPHMLRAEDVYSQFAAPFVPVPPPPPTLPTNGEKQEKMENSEIITSEIPIPDVSPVKNEESKKQLEKEKHNGIDLEELAMLGIDADDLCMTSFSKK